MVYAFDIEIFSNFFSVIFINVEDTFDEKVFLVYKDRNDINELREFVSDPTTLVGYNNLYFDNVLLNAILEYKSDLFQLAQDIISNHNEEYVKSLRYKKVPYSSIDFKEMIGLDISLKQALTVLEWPKIQELPFSPKKVIGDQDVPIILDYNRNDIFPLIKLWEELQPELKIRQKVNELYKVEVSSKSEGQLPNVIFETLYQQAIKKPLYNIKKQRTIRETIRLGDCVGRNISFQSEDLRRFLQSIEELDLIQGFKEYLSFGGLRFNLGFGGIHSQDSPGSFYSNKDYLIIDCDVTSFYPNIVLLNNIRPEHISPKFLDIFKGLIKQRMEAKKKGDTATADVLKIAINAVFGKLGNPDYWLYDLKSFYSVTISGQLYLLSLVEFLTLKGIEVISANTDGVTCKVKRYKESDYYQACKEWQKTTGFELEFAIYNRYIRRDVNNYIAQKDNGKLKRKGIFETKDDISLYKRLQKSYTPDIIPRALTNYFIYDKPVKETIGQSDNIFDFLMSQRIGKSFEVILRNGKGDEIQQRVNRYYVSNEGGILIKRDKDREISVMANTRVQIVNNVERVKPFANYKVNLGYYCSEVEKIINSIEVAQLQLF